MESRLEKLRDDKNIIDELHELASNPDADMTKVTPKVLEMYLDIILLDKWIMTYKKRRLVIDMFLKRKKDENKEVSVATAYRRFGIMERIFGKQHKTDRDYKRAFLEDWITETITKMEAAGQWRSIPAMFKLLVDISDLNATNEISMEALMKPNVFIMGYFPELVGEKMTGEEADRLKAKLTRKREAREEVEDAEFTVEDE